MSQKKVDEYKKTKANREKMKRRERLSLRIEMFLVALVCVAIVVWAGWSIGKKVTTSSTSETVSAETVEIDTSAIDDYLSTIAND